MRDEEGWRLKKLNGKQNKNEIKTQEQNEEGGKENKKERGERDGSHTEKLKVELLVMMTLLRKEEEYRDGILGHHFNKRLKSFASCYSVSASGGF